jgi:pimeloyl-ACP methyl ester carboxylesterase
MRKQVKTSLLDISYEENGSENSPPIILLHGFPDDAKTWNSVSNSLVKDGYRTLAPYQRGYGDTAFRSETTIRSAQYSALVNDLVEFTDALRLDKFLLVGHDWGSTVAFQMAALYPERIKGLVTLATSYNGAEQQQLSLNLTRAYWYQWFFNTEHGIRSLREERESFCHYLWKVWSPGWNFTADSFGATAASWDNPDFVDIVIHSYRYRWKNAKGDPGYEKLEKQLKEKPQIEIPVIFLQGDKDGASLPESSLNKERFFTSHYERRLVMDAGHFIQREKPEQVIQAIKDIIAMTGYNI